MLSSSGNCADLGHRPWAVFLRQVARGNYAFIAPNEAADYQLSKMAPEIACRVQKLDVEYAPGGIALGLQNNSPYKELFDQRWGA